MPIINRRKPPASSPSAHPPPPPPIPEPEPRTPQGSGNGDRDRDGGGRGPGGGRLIAGGAALVAGVAIAFLLPSLSWPVMTSGSGSRVDVVHEVERFARVSAMAVLARREHEMNFVSLTEAERAGGETTVAALQIIVDKNRDDLARLKAELAAMLAALHDVAVADPERVTRAFDAAAAAADARSDADVAALIRLGGRAVVAGVPDGMEPEGHFASAIERTF